MSIFEDNPKSRLPRSKFVLNHSRKFSMKIGALTPVFFEEAVPGDSFRVTPELMARLAPMITPAFVRMTAKIEHFYIPKRLCMKEYDEHRTGGVDGNAAPVVPYFSAADIIGTHYSAFMPGTYWDFFGLPTLPSDGSIPNPISAPKISALPFRALALVYNTWYRIPGVTWEIPDVTDSSGVLSAAEASALLTGWNNNPTPSNMLARRAWGRDYFTSAQPNAQRGGAGAAPIDIVYSDRSTVKTASGDVPVGGPLTSLAGGDLGVSPGQDGRLENISSATVLAESIRLAEKVQQFLEAMQRGGSRYVDFLWEIFKRKSQDSRLQRPEFLGGSTSNIQISEVLSTVQFEGTSAEIPQGNMAGHGLGVSRGAGFSYTAPEDGYFVSFLSIVPESGLYGAGHASGIPKLFQRFDRFDEYIPHFANLGEQPVTLGELTTSLLLTDMETQMKTVFGFVPRYSEFKWKSSSVHGDMRESLEFWHQHRKFIPSDVPVDNPMLNNNFLVIDDTDDDLNRIFAVTGGDHFWCYVYNNVSAIRPMSYNPMPSNS